MKVVLFAFAFVCFISIPVFAQNTPAIDKDKPKTDLELFQEKYGAVLVKGYSELPSIAGSGGAFQFTIMEFRNPANNTKVKGLVAEVNPSERYASSVRSFIEYGEIDSLIKGIGYISKIDKSVTTLQNFEAKYSTKGDFSITTFNGSDGTTKVAISVGRYGSKSIFIDPTALATIITQLQQIKTTLDSL